MEPDYNYGTTCAHGFVLMGIDNTGHLVLIPSCVKGNKTYGTFCSYNFMCKKKGTENIGHPVLITSVWIGIENMGHPVPITSCVNG